MVCDQPHAPHERRDAGARRSGCGSFRRALKLYEAAGTFGSTQPRIKADRANAAAYHDKACAAGCINRCDTLGDMLRDGNGIPRSAAVEAWWYSRRVEFEKEIARAIPPVVDTAADIYEGGRRAWHDVQTVGQIAHDTAEFGVRQAERAAVRPLSWAIDRGARAVGAAREAFDWIAD